MITRKHMIVIAFAAWFACAASRTFAQSFDLSWNTIDGGGSALSTGGTFQLAGTIGQPDAGPVPAMTGGAFSLVGGFWPGAGVTSCPLPGDMNVDGQRNGLDVQSFVACELSGGAAGCSCADVDGNGTVNNADVAPFVQLLLN